MVLLANVGFEAFYYTKDNQLHDLYEIQEEYERNDGDISKYRGYIFCPECKKAELSFTRQTSSRRAFLSKIPSSDHAEDCLFKNDYATNNEIRQYTKTLNNQQIQDKLESALNQLLPKKVKEDNVASNAIKVHPLVIIKNDKKGSSIKKVIPRKSINSWFDKSEENNLFVFYGKVKLEIQEIETEKGKFFRLIVKTKKKNQWKKKTSIFRGTIRDNICEENIYDIAVIGEIEFYKNFPQIKTITSHSIMYRKSKG